MRTTRPTTLRRTASVLSLATLALGLVAMSPVAADAATKAARGNDRDHATAADRASGAVRTAPDRAAKGTEGRSAAPAGKPVLARPGKKDTPAPSGGAASLAPPANDNFPGQTISGPDSTVSGTNVEATGESGEPSVAGSLADVTVWYTWVAPESGPTSFNLRDAAFDTTLAVHTGNAVNALTLVTANDEVNGTSQSKVTFTATAGATYRIVVDGWNAATGGFGLQWAQNSPANDNFDSPQPLSGDTGKYSQSTTRATGEPGEPVHDGVPNRSVWFTWTAPATGTVVVSTRESNFDTEVAAYSGSDITTLALLATGDDYGLSTQTRIDFPVDAGTTYRIAVDGFSGATGNLGLQWSLNPPANDDFDNAIALNGQFGSVGGDSSRATGEPGELDFHGGSIADASVWYAWTPGVSGPAEVVLSDVAPGFAASYSVYTGTDVAELTEVADSSISTFFTVDGSTTYYIAVDGSFGTTGAFELDYAANLPPTGPAVAGLSTGAGKITVSFGAPSSSGGSPVTGYQVQCVSSDGGSNGNASGASSPITVQFLSGGKSYRCRVRATNAVGTGGYGSYSGTVVLPPASAPPAPTVTSTTAGPQSAKVTFTTTGNGGSPITAFQVACNSTDGGISRNATGSASPITVTGLSAAKSYRCRVRATNAVGTGVYSAYGSTVVLPPPTAPPAPTVTGSTPSQGAVTVTFSPNGTGGSAITGYQVRCESPNGGVNGNEVGTGTTIKVTGLSGAKNYRCRVRATNAVGTGPYGAPGPTVAVPAGPPASPAVSASTPGAGSVQVTFTAGSNGGSAITGYQAQCTSTNGGTTGNLSGAASPLTVTGLTSGRSYRCRVRATNAIGTSAWSAYGATVVVG